MGKDKYKILIKVITERYSKYSKTRYNFSVCQKL